jgi:hypothetical protein
MSKKTIVNELLKTFIVQGTKDTQIGIQDYYLTQYKFQEQVTPKTRNRKLPCFSIFGDTSLMPTIQIMKSK